MLAVTLNENDKNLLQIIYKYGGYIRISHLSILFPELAYRTLQFRLDKLVKYGYLTKRRFTSDSKKEPVTYQVTQSACIACGNPNSTYRRKRPIEYAVRALIKNMFFIEIHNELNRNIITDLNKRREEFEKAGFKAEYFPQKLNISKNNEKSAIVQFEEFVIDFRKYEGKTLINDSKVLYADSKNTMIVVHIDQYHIEIKKQLNTLINRYINMINQNLNGIGFPINFLVVTCDGERKTMFENVISEMMNEYQYTDKISNSSLKMYQEFYEKLAKKDSNYSVMAQNIINKYNDNSLKIEAIDRAKNFKPDLAKPIYRELETGLKANGTEYLVNKIFDAVRQQFIPENARLIVEEYFDLLFYFELHNILKLDNSIKKNKYEIQVYCTANTIKFI